MTKNITVVDAQGNVYAKTYPRRAKGLVKKGRARFVNASVICLACPPYHMEDNRMDTMKDTINMDTIGMDTIKMDTGDIEEQLKETVFNEQPPVQLDSSYLIQKIDQIIADSGYLTTALQQLEKLDEAGAVAAGNMIEYRERTNQRMIDFLEKLMGKLAI